MKNLKQTTEEAAKGFEELKGEDLEFQESAILGPIVWRDAEKRGEVAKELLEKLGFTSIEVLTN